MKSNVFCDFCGKPIHQKPSRLNKHKHHFCSMRCKGKFKTEQTKKKVPKKLLEKLYTRQKLSFRQINKVLGINNRTISKLLKGYNIPIRYGSEAVKTQWIENEKRKLSQAIRFVRKTRVNRYISPYEQFLIDFLNQEQIPFEFQYPVHKYLLDFAFPDKRINIEIDGKEHRIEPRKSLDKERDSFLAKMGWEIYRFSNEEVMFKLPEILHILNHPQ